MSPIRITKFSALAVLFAVALPAVGTVASAAAAQTAEQEDAYIWLEEVEGERALGWAVERSDATLKEFEALPAFGELEAAALDVLASSDRIVYPSLQGDYIYNYWTDADHPRGIYRRTSWDSYLSGDPSWQTVLDVDALAEEEGVSWAYRGMSCLAPEHRRCLVALSRGGADAVETREFDSEALAFVESGFFLPEAKGGASFVDPETVIVATDFGPGTLTASGYPRQARLWKRGTPLADAPVIFEAGDEDMAIFTSAWKIGGTTYGAVTHLQTIFESTTYLVMDDELVRIDTPPDASTLDTPARWQPR